MLSAPKIDATDDSIKDALTILDSKDFTQIDNLLMGNCITKRFLVSSRNFLHDTMNVEKYRTNPVYFTRESPLSLPRLAILILSEHNRAIQTRINHVFDQGCFGNRLLPPTASAFAQARMKLEPEFFKAWTANIVDFFYREYPSETLVNTWHGMLVWAGDCSTIRLPDTPETKNLYTVAKNQNAHPGRVYGQASFLFDVLNEIPVNACLGKARSESSYVANEHLKHLKPGVVVVYDRGYASYEVVATSTMTGCHFVIRCPLTNSFKVVTDFAKSDKLDEIVIIQVPKNRKSVAASRGWPLQVKVRLVKLMLDNGDIEVLMTSLLDKVLYPASELKWLYGERWGVETAFGRFKTQLEVESFSSKKVHNILQDFHASVFLIAFESILDKVVDSYVLARSTQKNLEYEYRVNKAEAYVTLTNNLVRFLILDTNDISEHLLREQRIIRRSTTPVRPNRHYPRDEPTSADLIQILKYEKKRR